MIVLMEESFTHSRILLPWKGWMNIWFFIYRLAYHEGWGVSSRRTGQGLVYFTKGFASMRFPNPGFLLRFSWRNLFLPVFLNQVLWGLVGGRGLWVWGWGGLLTGQKSGESLWSISASSMSLLALSASSSSSAASLSDAGSPFSSQFSFLIATLVFFLSFALSFLIFFFSLTWFFILCASSISLEYRLLPLMVSQNIFTCSGSSFCSSLAGMAKNFLRLDYSTFSSSSNIKQERCFRLCFEMDLQCSSLATSFGFSASSFYSCSFRIVFCFCRVTSFFSTSITFFWRDWLQLVLPFLTLGGCAKPLGAPLGRGTKNLVINYDSGIIKKTYNLQDSMHRHVSKGLQLFADCLVQSSGRRGIDYFQSCDKS